MDLTPHITDQQIYEQAIYDKVERIVDAFMNSAKMSKSEFLRRVFESAFELIPEAEKGSYFELQGDQYVPILSRGYDMAELQKLSFGKAEAFADFTCDNVSGIETYEKVINKRSDDQYDPETIQIFMKLGTYRDFITIYAPIQVDDEHIGILCLDNFSLQRFTTLSKKILKFYAQMISNFYAMIVAKEKEEQLHDEVVMTLVSAIEVNDTYTVGHGIRVRDYSVAIARKMKLSEEKIHDIATAALLHDVGKIGIPTEVLNKPGKLTDEEYGMIQQHPTFTKQILGKITRFSTIVDYAYCHHEYYNGKGYPRGLEGPEIPLGSQIIIVADVFDALTSDRAYRKAFTVDEAVEIIRSEKGQQFHPGIAEVAIEVFQSMTRRK